MAKLSVVGGTTSKRIGIFLQDSSSSTGAGLAGLAFNSASLSCYYWIDTAGNAGGTSVTLATATRGTWTSGGFVEKDATNLPGVYEFGIPNACIASGVKWCIVMFKGATNLAPLVLEIEVTAVDNQSATSFITGVNGMNPPTAWNTSVAQSGDAYAALGAFPLKKNTASQHVPFYMRDSTDPTVGKTGVPTVTKSIDGTAAWSSTTGTVTEIGNGAVDFSPSAADCNGTLVRFKAVLSGAVTQVVDIYTHV